jgi:hypothetical protein
MGPFEFNRVEPGTLDRQIADQHADASALLLDGAVVHADPGAHGLTHTPGGVIPDQRPDGGAHGRQLGATPVENRVVSALTGHPAT